MTQHTASAIENLRREAFEALASELSELDPKTLAPYNLDATYAAAVVLDAVPGVAFLDKGMGHLPDFDVKSVKRLPRLANALLHANALVNGHSPQIATFDADIIEARTLREVLLSTADTLVHKKKISPETVQKLREGSGYRDLVEDLAALTEMLSPFVGGLVERTDLDQASALVQRLTLGLGQRSGEDPALAGLLLQRRKVASLLTKTYAQLQRAVDFLRWSDGDARTLTPTIYVPGSPRTAASKASEKPVEKPVETAERGPGTTPARNPPIAPGRPGGIDEPADRPFDLTTGKNK